MDLAVCLNKKTDYERTSLPKATERQAWRAAAHPNQDAYRCPLEAAKAPCGTACPESALTLSKSVLIQKRWIIAAL